MASIKISELNEYTEVQDDDLFVVVDVNNEETKKVKATNIGTGGKELIMVGNESDATKNTKLLIETDTLASLGTEVVNSLEGNETDRAPSVYAVNKALETKVPNTYSTEEQVIGTWIDGKPLYRKVISLSLSKYGDNLVFDHNIKDLQNIVDATCVFKRNNGDFYIINRTNPSSSNNYIGLTYINKTSISLAIASVFSTQITDAFVTIEYTKTTDSVATTYLEDEGGNE